jgi:ABC-type branched-subunit amino acid transport system ATPase component
MPDTTDAAIHARGLTLTGPRGPVYAGVDLTLRRAGLAAIVGAGGSGRTSLLLTLAGRMRPTTGTLVVEGHDLPRRAAAVHRSAGLAEIHGVNELDEPMTVAEHVRERIAGTSPWWHFGVTRSTPLRIREVLARVAVLEPERDVLLPTDIRVGALGAPDRWRLGVALALAGNPGLLFVDDLDAIGNAEEVTLAWRILRRLADSGVTVVAACTDETRIPDGIVDTVVRLDADAPDAFLDPRSIASSESSLDPAALTTHHETKPSLR